MSRVSENHQNKSKRKNKAAEFSKNTANAAIISEEVKITGLFEKIIQLTYSCIS